MLLTFFRKNYLIKLYFVIKKFIIIISTLYKQNYKNKYSGTSENLGTLNRL